MPAHLLDSSAWIECLDEGPNTRHFGPVLRKLPDLVVPVIVITKVRRVILAQRNRDDAQAVTDSMLSGIVTDIDAEIATHAADLFIKHKLPLADSIVYATALARKATVWTQDEDFKGLPHVKYFPKIRE